MARLKTQSYVKIILITLLGILILSTALFGNCSGGLAVLRNAPFTQTGSAEIDASQVENIEISWAAGSVDVTTHAGDDILLVESSTGNMSKAQMMRWDVSGKTLHVDYGTWLSCSMVGVKRLEVFIPQKLAAGMGELAVDGASGSYAIEGITCEKLQINLASGSAKTKGVQVNDSALFDIASGKVEFSGVIAGKLVTNAVSGTIDVACNKVAPKVVEVDLVSGTTRLSIPENDGFTAEIDKVSGRFESDFETQQQGDTYVHKDGSTSIRASMVSGKFILNKQTTLDEYENDLICGQ